jgi:hypothetical protein
VRVQFLESLKLAAPGPGGYAQILPGNVCRGKVEMETAGKRVKIGDQVIVGMAKACPERGTILWGDLTFDCGPSDIPKRVFKVRVDKECGGAPAENK